MLQTKSIFWKEINSNPYLSINLVFAFFPFSFIIGSLVVNFNLLLFCCLGIFYLKSKILRTKYDFAIKIIFLFFLIVFLSSTLNVVKSQYFDSRVNKIVYFNPTEALGVGTIAGIGSTSSYTVGEVEFAVSTPAQSIYLPNHPFTTNQQLILSFGFEFLRPVK